MDSNLKHYYLLTATSGTGKTSLINSLRSNKFCCSEENVRKVLKEQLNSDGPGLPSKYCKLFVQMMVDYSVDQYNKFLSSVKSVFFDRGLPDTVAYGIRFEIDTEEFNQAAQKYRYNKTAFICAPWKDIFINDSERKGTFEMYKKFHQVLVTQYEKLDYELIEVPFMSIEDRKIFILDFIKNQ